MFLFLFWHIIFPIWCASTLAYACVIPCDFRNVLFRNIIHHLGNHNKSIRKTKNFKLYWVLWFLDDFFCSLFCIWAYRLIYRVIIRGQNSTSCHLKNAWIQIHLTEYSILIFFKLKDWYWSQKHTRMHRSRQNVRLWKSNISD